MEDYSTLENMMAYLDEGKIVDMGTHDELITREGFYSNVWNLQQMIEEVAE